jgi:hypothetical protein
LRTVEIVTAALQRDNRLMGQPGGAR